MGMMTWGGRVIVVLLLLGWHSQAPAGEMFPASVMKVIDGDSLLVATAQKTIEIRLYGVDSPEYDQPFSRKAKNFVRKKVLGKTVMIEAVTEDSYGRTVAVVARGEEVLNRDLIQAGFAWVYPRYCKKDFCAAWKSSESLARRDKVGLWRDPHPDPPWRWRKKKAGR